MIDSGKTAALRWVSRDIERTMVSIASLIITLTDPAATAQEREDARSGLISARRKLERRTTFRDELHAEIDTGSSPAPTRDQSHPIAR